LLTETVDDARELSASASTFNTGTDFSTEVELFTPEAFSKFSSSSVSSFEIFPFFAAGLEGSCGATGALTRVLFALGFGAGFAVAGALTLD
jgi:hypothetical protein